MADCYRRFCCCVDCPRIHPARPAVQNVIDGYDSRHRAALALSNDLMFSSVQTTSVPLKSSSAVNSCSDQNAMITSLHAAAVNGDKALLRKLLNCGGSEVDVVDRFDRTPLVYSVLGDRPICAELLLKSGADIDRKDVLGRTALHWAAHKVTRTALPVKAHNNRGVSNDPHGTIVFCSKKLS